MVTPVLTTKTLPLVLKAAAALPGSVLQQLLPTVAMVTTAITKSDLQNAPINLQVAGKLTGQSSEPVRLVSKNAIVVRPSPLSHWAVARRLLRFIRTYVLSSGSRIAHLRRWSHAGPVYLTRHNVMEDQ